MESVKQEIKQLCEQFRLGGIYPGLDTALQDAEKENTGYAAFTLKLLRAEADHRSRRDEAKPRAIRICSSIGNTKVLDRDLDFEEPYESRGSRTVL
ncbi:hypothetical protein [Parapedobacter soli]|uniref:hypothetical protein n=1 Tax=Parapedobacter soli TaxID=416955 RepID=UPI0021C74769|nr:hypothetical protein [Parapedobacter soli]